MKILTWNCNGALRRKVEFLDSFEADVLIIQECEDPSKYKGDYLNWAGNYLWTGDNKNKGLGVFVKNGHHLSALPWKGTYTIPGILDLHPSASWTTDELKIFLPVAVNNHLKILAVWTKGSDQEAFGYIGQLWKYLQIHREDLSGPSTLLVGDLNSNVIWDKPDRWWSHSGVVKELNQVGLKSLYHHQTDESQGLEKSPTFYLHRNKSKPYHIDYVFASSDLINACHLEIGTFEEWIDKSDHMPLVMELNCA